MANYSGCRPASHFHFLRDSHLLTEAEPGRRLGATPHPVGLGVALGSWWLLSPPPGRSEGGGRFGQESTWLAR